MFMWHFSYHWQQALLIYPGMSQWLTQNNGSPEQTTASKMALGNEIHAQKRIKGLIYKYEMHCLGSSKTHF